MKRNLASKLLVKSLVFPVILLLSSCGSNANLAKIQEFSHLSNSAKEALPKLADDVYLSCLREARYAAVSTLPSNPKNTNEHEQRTGDNPLQRRSDDQDNCNKVARNLGPMIKKGNSIIVAYMQKLGALASDNLVDFDPEFNELKQNSNNLVSALNENELRLQPEQVKAGFNIFQFLTEGILNGKRINTLQEVIPSVDQPLQTYVNGLKTVIEKVYIESYLNIEEKALDNYYKIYIQDILNSKTRTEGDSTLALTEILLKLDDRWNDRKDEIQKRRDLAYSYISLLGAITTSHHDLALIYGKGKTPSSQEVNKMLKENTKALKSFVNKAEELP